MDVTDGYRAQNSELGGNGLIFLRAGHVTDSHIDFTGVDRFHDELTPRLKEKISQPGDVAVTTKGNSTGRIAFVTATMPPFVYSPHLSRWRSLDRDQLEPGFLRYWSSGREFAIQLRGMSASTDMAPYLSLRDQRRLKLTLPHIDSQRAIANVLGALDEKIEQNRQTAQALERLVRAIFRAWFVDFEPVRAKAVGASTFPSVPQPVFDALPTRFVDFAIGPVPEGWDVGKLGDHCRINQRSVGAGEMSGVVEYVDISSVTVGRLTGLQRVPFSEAPSRARRRIGHGDTIWSCVRPNHRSHLFIHSPPEKRIVSTGFAVLSPSSFGPSFLYEITTQPEFVDYLVSNADGSAYPAVRSDHFASAEIVVPPQVMRDAFEEITMPLRDSLAASERESASLGAMRDYLLPKLLSGEVRAASA